MKIINNNHTMYDSWYSAWLTKFLSFWIIFCPFTPPPHLHPPHHHKTENQNLKKMKKIPADVIILHKCTKNHDHMLCTVPEICCVTDGLFWVIFCPFNPLRAQKIKISKNEKVPGDTIILHKCAKNNNHMLYSPFLQWPLTAPKMKFQRNEKKPRDIIILHMYTRNYD